MRKRDTFEGGHAGKYPATDMHMHLGLKSINCLNLDAQLALDKSFSLME